MQFCRSSFNKFQLLYESDLSKSRSNRSYIVGRFALHLGVSEQVDLNRLMKIEEKGDEPISLIICVAAGESAQKSCERSVDLFDVLQNEAAHLSMTSCRGMQ